MSRDSTVIINSIPKDWKWVIQIDELLERDESETAIESPPSIFQLPESIRNANPDAYLPRRMALGPHHHFRPELYNMQLYKLHIAKKTQQTLKLPDFDQLRDQLAPLELKIRACFDTHLQIGDDSLAYVMLVDALVLLRLLFNFRDEHPFEFLPFPNFDFQNLFNNVDSKLVGQFEILSDVLKLENQIPILVFKGINLPSSLYLRLPFFFHNFCVSILPFFSFSFEKASDIPSIFFLSHHLLHFMYLSVLTLPVTIRLRGGGPTSSTDPPISFLLKCLSTLGSVLNIDLIQQLVEILWMLKNLSSSSSSTRSPPLIPSASQLHELGVEFGSLISHELIGNKWILDIEFSITNQSATLYLPIIRINAFTKPLFENLVAFETMANINPPAFARYLEFMKALLPTPKDVNILKNENILVNLLESDEQVVELFQEVGSSISALNNNKPCLKKLNHLNLYQRNPNRVNDGDGKELIYTKIKEKYEKGLSIIGVEINQYCETFWRFKTKRFVKMYAFSVLKIFFTFFILSLIILLLARSVIDSLKSISHLI